ncbi:MAG: hypothetical protein ABGX46_00970, partial [Candidatus Thioglobus sp.]
LEQSFLDSCLQYVDLHCPCHNGVDDHDFGRGYGRDRVNDYGRGRGRVNDYGRDRGRVNDYDLFRYIRILYTYLTP